jgi:hypothetical protein
VGSVGPRVQAPRARDALHGDAEALLDRVMALGTPNGTLPQRQAQPPRQAQPRREHAPTVQPPAPGAPAAGGVPLPADRQARSRLDEMEARLTRLESGVDDVPTLKRAVVALARTHKAEAERLQFQPADLERLVDQAVKQYVENHVEALLDEASSLPDDVEGVYKELDRFAELFGERDAALDASLERMDSLERSVGRLRRNLEQAVLQLEAAAAAAPQGARCATPEDARSAAPQGARSAAPGTPAPSPGLVPGPAPVAATVQPVRNPLGPLGDGPSDVDAALERARRRRDLSRRVD